MLSELTNELNLPEGLNYTILKEAMIAKGYSFATMEGLTLIAEGTLKNILSGKVKKTSAQTLNKICKVLGVPLEKVLGTEEVKKQIETQGIKVLIWIFALLAGFVGLGYGFYGLDKVIKTKSK